MIYKTTAIIAMACLSFSGFSQTDSTNKKIDHYISFQVNQLIRQVFNFSNNSTGVNVPYLLNYSMVSAKSKIGFNVGLGYTFDQFKNDDPANERKTDIDNLFFRAGFEKKSTLGRSWLLGFGFDLLVNKQKSETTSTIKTNNGNGSGKIVTTTTGSQNGGGFGPRATLSYYITSRILIGTEANFYFNRAKSKDELVTATTQLEFDPATNSERMVTHTERTKSDDKSKHIGLSIPTVIWMTVRF
jgi:hypothetical protein